MLHNACCLICTYMKDPKLQSFNVIIANKRTETEGIVYIDCNLGIESWLIKDLYCYVHKKTLSRQPDGLDVVVTVACLLNPDVKTFWNIRRELNLKKQFAFHDEIVFISHLLKYKPKCYDAYAYRKWVIIRMLEKDIRQSLKTEIVFVKSIASIISNNHMVWDYFRAIFPIMKLSEHQISYTVQLFKILSCWLEYHVSDTSAFSFLAFLFFRILKNGNHVDEEFRSVVLNHICETKFNKLNDADSVQFGLLLREFHLNGNMISFFANHEALWTYRRFLTYLWFNELPSTISECGMNKLHELVPAEGIFNQLRILYQDINDSFITQVQNNNDWYLTRFNIWFHKMIK